MRSIINVRGNRLNNKKATLHRITFKDIWAVFFPKNFYEKYKYLGTVPHNEEGEIFKAIYPLVLALDYEAKPKWCPRWFLRFLHLFGSDNSIVRVRSMKLHMLEKHLTKGLMIWDYKTKYDWYDLRISVSGPWHIQHLSDAIENSFYTRGKRKDLLEALAQIPEAQGKYKDYFALRKLERIYEKYTSKLQ